ncbi:MAG: hypothetical protein Ct9H300mP13_7650 [Gammaproteobacteria bacterium]|nr:MAG: hypothetical protein Ct9H300mP13_7650 [Gammaproteobacteria bacterium]
MLWPSSRSILMNKRWLARSILDGRAKEVERTIQILCAAKNNPLYVGEAGVGKLRCRGFWARQIVEGEVPDILIDSTIYALDLGTLLAGTKYRGDFEDV